MNQLKDLNMLPNNVLTQMIVQLVRPTQIKKLAPSNLAGLLIILKSDEVTNAFKLSQDEGKADISKVLQGAFSKIENAFLDELLKNKNSKIDARIFGQICYTIDEEATMSSFINKVQSRCLLWMKTNELELEELPDVLRAFHLNNEGGIYDEIIERLENYALKNFIGLTTAQAANLIIQNGYNLKNAELVEVCEKIIAPGINEMYLQDDGASTVLNLFKEFIQTKHARSKMIELLMDKISTNINMLNTQEQCDFVASLRQVFDELADFSGQVGTEINHTTQVEATLETIQPYIISKINVLTVEDLTNAFIGFSHPHVSERFDILDQIEGKITK